MGEGENVLPLRTAGLIEVGIADQAGTAAFLDWTAELGMQRLDALVPTFRAPPSGRDE